MKVIQKHKLLFSILAIAVLLQIAIIVAAFVANDTNKELLNESQEAEIVTTSELITSENASGALRFVEVEPIQARIQSATSVAEVSMGLEDLMSAYNLSLITEASSTFWATWDGISEDTLSQYKAYASVFVDEWSKYPPEWIAQHGLGTIWFVQGLLVTDEARAAMPQAPSEMVYDVTYGSDVYARSVIHHEYHHFVDYSRTGDYYFTDQEWDDFNQPDFTYGEGGAAAYDDPNYEYIGHPDSGLVSSYAAYGEEEDRAELFSYLFYTPYYSQLQSWTAEDDLLQGKTQYMIETLQSEHSGFTDEYFAQIHNLE